MPKSEKFIIRGGQKIHGKISVGGSKNATLPIMAACLLTDEPSTLTNVPDIADMHTMRELLRMCGASTDYDPIKKRLIIYPPHSLKTSILKNELVKQMRASILLLAPLLAREKEVTMTFPGGCVLGKRSVTTHLKSLAQLGYEITESPDVLKMTSHELKPSAVILPEMSVTATENVLMAAANIPGATTIYLAATEPHVQDLCHFLTKMGANIRGIGTHILTVIGKKKLKGAKHEVVGDYLQAGTLAISALITGGSLKIDRIDPHQLDLFLEKLTETGAKIERGKKSFSVTAPTEFRAVSDVKTAVYPGFPTDLQAPFVVLMTQAKGKTHIFETLFEGRLNYLFELEKMGAKIEFLNPHQAIIHGPTPLKGVPIASCDIRAGAAMVIAALAAQETTEISNINFIDRGYEKLDEKLNQLGAQIKRA